MPTNTPVMVRTFHIIGFCMLLALSATGKNTTHSSPHSNSAMTPDSALVLKGEALIAGTGTLNFIERTPDKNFVIVGATTDFPTRIIITKYTPEGQRLWASYVGSSTGEEYCNGMTIDNQGNIVITGRTHDYKNNLDFNGFDNTYGGGMLDAFVAKFDGSGMLLWSSYLGGGDMDSGCGLAINSNGDIYVSGVTWSTSNLAVNGKDLSFGGYADAFLAKISATGQLIWSSYYGGTGYDKGSDVAVDDNHVYLFGTTWSENDIAYNGIDNTLGVDLSSPGGHDDAFLVKFDPDGNRIWATYFGGDRTEYGEKIELDPTGNLIVAGITYNEGIAFNGYDMSINGYYDVFLAKFTNTGELIWSTYYGGEEGDDVFGLHVDKKGDAIIVGKTLSQDGIANKALVNEFTGSDPTDNGFIARFTNNGQQVWSTYYYNNVVQGVTTDADRDLFIVGHHIDTTTYAAEGFITQIGYEPVFGYVKGIVFDDLNGDCALQEGEGGIENITIQVSPYLAPSELSGEYFIQVDPGNYEVYPLIVPEGLSITVHCPAYEITVGRNDTIQVDVGVMRIVNGAETTLSKLIELYPNPTLGKIFIQAPKECHVNMVEVFDSRGLRVSQQTPKGRDGLYDVTLTGTPAIYLIRLKTNKGIVYRRVSLQ